MAWARGNHLPCKNYNLISRGVCKASRDICWIIFQIQSVSPIYGLWLVPPTGTSNFVTRKGDEFRQGGPPVGGELPGWTPVPRPQAEVVA